MLSPKIQNAIKDNKYAVVGMIGKMSILSYAGSSKKDFKDCVRNNACINLQLYVDKKPVHKESILFDETI